MLRALLLLLWLSIVPVLGSAASVVTTPQVRAELVAHAPEGVGAGKPLWLGLIIQHQPHWHTYWKNPGDSGLPTTFDWKLPAGLQAGEIRWPTPKKLPIGPLMNFGYEGRLLLAVPVSVSADMAGTATAISAEIELEANWLVCKDVCIPESGRFSLSLPVNAATAGHAALFKQTEAALPVPAAGAKGTARIEAGVLLVEVDGLPAALRGRELGFLPETPGVIQNAAPVQADWSGARWTARVPLDPQRSDSPNTMPVVLVGDRQPAGFEVQVVVQGPWPAPAPAAAPLPALGDAKLGTPAPAGTGTGSGGADDAATLVSGSFAASLLFALLGGLLLNLMPCVFPVLSLKVVAFSSQGADRRSLLAGGVAYSAGVVLSFVALAAALMTLRAGGEHLGWGFQLQSPLFIAALAALFTLIGLNLAGLFELGSLLPARWSAARAQHPLADSALTGVLAVAVASPCTAPFMGAALGFALTQPTAQALAVFAALGLGMALPYLAASASPAFARALPRPGPWLASFKALMAFPMFATVIWLVWVLGQQTSIDGAAALLAALLALAFVAWALGSPGLGRRGRAAFTTMGLALLAAAVVWALPALEPAEAATARAPGGVDVDGWAPWSPEAVLELTRAGRPVFVDFTAAWCVTCQLNKRTTLHTAAMKAEFANKNVSLLRADWTRRDARITAELARLGRSGVPVYALYAPGGAAPRLLSELLSTAEVTSALATLP